MVGGKSFATVGVETEIRNALHICDTCGKVRLYHSFYIKHAEGMCKEYLCVLSR